MARKTRDYAREYERRIARGVERGQTRQSARGHVVREHVRRKEREIEQYGISSAQMRSIRAWVSQYKNESRDAEDVIEQAGENGYSWFENYRDTWNASRRAYLRELKSGSYASKGIGYLEMLAGLEAVPDVSWAYYH